MEASMTWVKVLQLKGHIGHLHFPSVSRVRKSNSYNLIFLATALAGWGKSHQSGVDKHLWI